MRGEGVVALVDDDFVELLGADGRTLEHAPGTWTLSHGDEVTVAGAARWELAPPGLDAGGAGYRGARRVLVFDGRPERPVRLAGATGQPPAAHAST